MVNELVAHSSDINRVLGSTGSTAIASVAIDLQDGASGEPPSSAGPPPCVSLSRHAVDASSPLLDASATTFFYWNVREARPPVHATIYQDSTSKSSMPSELSSSTGPPHPSVMLRRAIRTSSPLPDAHAADPQDACNASSSVIAVPLHALVSTSPSLPPTPTRGTTSIELVAPGVGDLREPPKQSDGLAHKLCAATTHDVFGVLPSTADASGSIAKTRSSSTPSPSLCAYDKTDSRNHDQVAVGAPRQPRHQDELCLPSIDLR